MLRYLPSRFLLSILVTSLVLVQPAASYAVKTANLFEFDRDQIIPQQDMVKLTDESVSPEILELMNRLLPETVEPENEIADIATEPDTNSITTKNRLSSSSTDLTDMEVNVITEQSVQPVDSDNQQQNNTKSQQIFLTINGLYDLFLQSTKNNDAWIYLIILVANLLIFLLMFVAYRYWAEQYKIK